MEKGKKEERMNPHFLSIAAGMLKGLEDLTSKAMDFIDQEKQTKSINQLHEGVSDSYALMREIVKNDESLSSDEKIEKLKEIANEERIAKEHCNDIIDNHQEKAARVVKDVFAGFLTAGLSFTPRLIKGIKEAVNDKAQLPSETIENFDIIESELHEDGEES